MGFTDRERLLGDSALALVKSNAKRRGRETSVESPGELGEASGGKSAVPFLFFFTPLSSFPLFAFLYL